MADGFQVDSFQNDSFQTSATVIVSSIHITSFIAAVTMSANISLKPNLSATMSGNTLSGVVSGKLMN